MPQEMGGRGEPEAPAEAQARAGMPAPDAGHDAGGVQ